MTTSEEFWDKTAEKYAKGAISDEATYQRKLAETQSVLSRDMRIVEFGCGTGTTAIQHAPHVQHIDATDISESMLQIARRRAREAGITNITFTHGSLQELGAPDSSVDAVLGLNVLHLVADRRAEIMEVSRILKPGGFFIHSTVCLKGSYLRFLALIAPLGRRLGLLPDVFVLSEAELTREVKEAGFHIERQWHHGRSDISVFMIARKL